MNTISKAALAALTLAAASHAQITLTTEGAYGVFAKDGNRVDLKTIAPNTSITTAQTLRANVGGATATAQVGLRAATARLVDAATLVRNAPTSSPSGGTTKSSGGAVAQGPHSLIYGITGSGSGVLVIEYNGRAATGSSASVMVDIGANGSTEFAARASGQPVTRRIAVRVNGSLKIRLTSNGKAEVPQNGRSGGYQSTLSVRFDRGGDDPCTFSPYGTSCGPRLAGTDNVQGNVHNITMRATNAAAGQPVLFIIGERQTQLPIPGTRCFLATIGIVDAVRMADRSGTANLSFRVSGPLSGIAYSQAISFDRRTRRFTTSNGMKIDCGR